MPVTAKLSQKFYERLGDDIANELVDWFNQVDATYRADLRELNELNFSRFDAKLEQRASQLEAKIDQKVNQLETKVDHRVSQLESKMDERLVRLEAKLDQRVAQLDAKIEKRVAELDAKLEQRISEVKADLAAQRADLIKWMFIFWAGTLLPLAGLIVALRP